MNCPQCGTGLGEGAKACATCGWTKSRKTLWIVLGCVFGFLFLVCCGGGTFFFFKMKKIGEAMQGEIVPVQVTILRTQVVNFAQRKGKPPANLEEAAAEPMVAPDGKKVEIQFQSNGKSVDVWGREFRFTMNPDRTFEIRSSGKDGQFDNTDDIVGGGSLDDDLGELQKATETEARKMGERMGEGFLREFGFDPKKLKEKDAPAPVPEAPPAPAPGEGGGK